MFSIHWLKPWALKIPGVLFIQLWSLLQNINVRFQNDRCSQLCLRKSNYVYFEVRNMNNTCSVFSILCPKPLELKKILRVYFIHYCINILGGFSSWCLSQWILNTLWVFIFNISKHYHFDGSSHWWVNLAYWNLTFIHCNSIWKYWMLVNLCICCLKLHGRPFPFLSHCMLQ